MTNEIPNEQPDEKPNEKTSEKHNYKLSNKEFLEALSMNHGLYADTARMIEERYGIRYSRQAVRDRAQKFPEELKEMREEMVELCESELMRCIKQDNNLQVKLRAITFALKALGRKRGYGKDGIDEIAEQTPEQVWEIDGKILRF